MELEYPVVMRKVFDSQNGLEYFPLPIHQPTKMEKEAAEFANKARGGPRAVRLPGYNKGKAEAPTNLSIYEQVQGIAPKFSLYQEKKDELQLRKNLAEKIDMKNEQRKVINDFFYNIGNEVTRQQVEKLRLAGMDTALANELIGRQTQQQANLASQIQGPPNPFRLASGESAQAQVVNGAMDALAQNPVGFYEGPQSTIVGSADSPLPPLPSSVGPTIEEEEELEQMRMDASQQLVQDALGEQGERVASRLQKFEIEDAMRNLNRKLASDAKLSTELRQETQERFGRYPSQAIQTNDGKRFFEEFIMANRSDIEMKYPMEFNRLMEVLRD